MEEFIAQLRARIDAAKSRRDEILDTVEKREVPEGEKKELTSEEDTEFRALLADLTADQERLADIEVQQAAEARSGNVSKALGINIEVKSEPLTYTSQRSTYFSDLFKLTRGDTAAQKRLERHGVEMDVELPKREARRAQNAEREIRGKIGWDAPSPFERGLAEERTNPNRTDGTGGYLVPPLWMMDELIPLLRAGRATADQMTHFDLPDGTDSINIPKLSTGTTAAIQTADAASVSSTDFTDTSVSAGVKTIAGQQDISMQLLEQSPLMVDRILFTDLIADYNKKLDVQVLAGSNASGQVQGLYSSAGASSWTGYSSVAYTDASPTVPEFWAPMAQSLSKVSQARFSIQSAKMFMHPRRWFWIVGGLDSSNRPLVVPSNLPSFNAISANADQVAEGFVGNSILGVPIFIDANITTADTAGSGSAQDILLTLNTQDAYLFEGSLRQRTLPEVLSGTLQVRFQVYNYVAFLLRYGEALAIASGTGFSAPSGY